MVDGVGGNQIKIGTISGLWKKSLLYLEIVDSLLRNRGQVD